MTHKADEWPDSGDVDEHGYCRGCRTYWCPHAAPQIYPELAVPIRVRDKAFARTGDPWTSHAAAASLSPERLTRTQAAVLAAFDRFGAMHHELLIEKYEAERVEQGWPMQSVSGLRTRTSELVDRGLLRDTGRVVPMPSRRASKVWEKHERPPGAAVRNLGGTEGGQIMA